MTKVLVNPGHTLSVKGRPYPAGQIVDVDPSQVKRLTAERVISDPTKPLLPTPKQAALAEFKKNPPSKPAEGGEAGGGQAAGQGGDGGDGEGEDGGGQGDLDDALKAALP